MSGSDSKARTSIKAISGVDRYALNVEGIAIITSNVGIGTTEPTKMLDVNGTMLVRDDAIFEDNVGIGTTSARQTLDIDGIAIISSNIGIGTVHPTKMLDVNGTMLVRDDAIFEDNVGIGTTSARQTLDVDGIAIISSNIGIGTVHPTKMLDVNGTMLVRDDAIFEDNVGIGTTSARQTLDIDGIAIITSNVGIGTVHPTKMLDVNGTMLVRDDAIFEDNVGIGTTSARQTLDVDGIAIISSNIGIGTVHPTKMLDVNGTMLVRDDAIFEDNVGIGTTSARQTLDVDGIAIISSNIGIGTVHPTKMLDVNGMMLVRDDAIFEDNVGIGTTSARQTLDIDGIAIITSNIGIGTTDPKATLDVIGTVKFPHTSNVNFLNMEDSLYVQFNKKANVGSGLFVGNVGISANTSNAILTRQLLDVQGGNVIVSDRVGIGTAYPLKTLHVEGNAKVTSSVTFGSNLDVNSPSTFKETLGVGSTDLPRKTLDVRGIAIISSNVGIGTINPTKMLHVVGDAKITGAVSLNSNVTITDPTESSNVTSGALVVEGGIGVKMSVIIGSNLDVNSPSTFKETLGVGSTDLPRKTLDVHGSAIISSNLGVGTADPTKMLHVVGDAKITGAVSLNSNVTITDPSDSTNVTNGALVVEGGIGVKKSVTIGCNLTIGGNFTVKGTTTFVDTKTLEIKDNIIKINAGIGNNTTPTFLRSGIEIDRGSTNTSNYLFVFEEDTKFFKIGISTDRGNSGKGLQAVATREDIVYENSIAVWDNVNKKYISYSNVVVDTNPQTSSVRLGIGTPTPTKMLHVEGDAKITGAVTLDNIVTISNVSDSSNVTSGALVVRGGIGVAKSVNIDSNLYVNSPSTFKETLGVGSTSLPRKTLDVHGSAIISSNLGVGTADPTKMLHVVGDAKITGAVSLDSNVTISNVSDSTNVTNGALVVKGGIGVAKSVTIGSNLDVTSPSTFKSTLGVGSTSLPRKTLDVHGSAIISSNLGVGTINPTKMLHVVGDAKITGIVTLDNIVTISNVSDSSNVTSGALVVKGGIGVAKSVTIGSNLDVTSPSTFKETLGVGSTLVPRKTLDVHGSAIISGDVGIGIINPTAKLHVVGDATITGLVSAPQLFLSASTATQNISNVDSSNLTNTYISFGGAGSTSDYAHLRQIGSGNDFTLALDLHDDGSESFQIRNIHSSGTSTDTINVPFTAKNGKVGIMNTNPTSTLDVTGTANVTGAVTAASFSGNGSALSNLSAAKITSGTLLVERGGIGTTSATQKHFFASPNASNGAPTFRTIQASDITSGTLLVERGGIGTTSVPAKRFFASPNSITGAPTFRTIIESDVPDLSAAKITTGTLLNTLTTATSTNTGGAIVARDNSGNFSACNITATSFSGNGSNLSNLDAAKITSGILSVSRGGIGTDLSTGTGRVVLSADPTLTGNVRLPLTSQVFYNNISLSNILLSNLTDLTDVNNAIALKAPSSNPTFTGTVVLPYDTTIFTKPDVYDGIDVPTPLFTNNTTISSTYDSNIWRTSEGWSVSDSRAFDNNTGISVEFINNDPQGETYSLDITFPYLVSLSKLAINYDFLPNSPQSYPDFSLSGVNSNNTPTLIAQYSDTNGSTQTVNTSKLMFKTWRFTTSIYDATLQIKEIITSVNKIDYGTVRETLDSKAPLESPTFTGNVGIGTTDPTETLDVAGTMLVRSNVHISGNANITGTVGTKKILFEEGTSVTERPNNSKYLLSDWTRGSHMPTQTQQFHIVENPKFTNNNTYTNDWEYNLQNDFGSVPSESSSLLLGPYTSWSGTFTLNRGGLEPQGGVTRGSLNSIFSKDIRASLTLTKFVYYDKDRTGEINEWIEIEYPLSVSLERFGMFFGERNDNSATPLIWRIQGYNDTDTQGWVTIAEFDRNAGSSFSSPPDNRIYWFDIQNSLKFKKFRLYVVSVESAVDRDERVAEYSLTLRQLFFHTSVLGTINNNWNAIAWAPKLGIFAAVKTTGTNRVMTSPDGITWTEYQTFVNDNSEWQSIVWAQELGIFVAVASSGTNRVMTSPNGINWTAQVPALYNQWWGIAWAPERGLFVAVADESNNNHVMISDDGINWTAHPSASPNYGLWRDITWAAEIGLFTAVGITDGNHVMTSPDGINWIERTVPKFFPFISIAWAPEIGLFAAVANDGDIHRVMTSSNGITWTARVAASLSSWRSITWASELGIFVAVASDGGTNSVMTSLDGITWTERTSPSSEWSSIVWAPELYRFAALSLSGNVMTSDFSDTRITYDTSVAPTIDLYTHVGNNWRSIAWAQELGIFAAVCDNYVMTSHDGITWDNQVAVQNSTWMSIVWAPELGIFVAVGDDSVMTSADGVTWNNYGAPDNIWQSIAWAPELGIFVAVASSGSNRVMTSYTGIHWTSHVAASDGSIWESIAWAPELGLFVAVASSGGNLVMTSPDGINWVEQGASEINPWQSIVWAPEIGIFAAVATSGDNRVMTSPDGITWTGQRAAELLIGSGSFSMPGAWRDITWSPEIGVFVAVSQVINIMTSPDGINWTGNGLVAINWQSIVWAPELGIFVAGANNNTVMTIQYQIDEVVPYTKPRDIVFSSDKKRELLRINRKSLQFKGDVTMSGITRINNNLTVSGDTTINGTLTLPALSNVTFGGTSLDSPTFSGLVSTTGGIFINKRFFTLSAQGAYIGWNYGGSGGRTTFANMSGEGDGGWDFVNNNSIRARISGTGDYSKVSDGRLKTDNVCIENATAILQKLRPQTYTKWGTFARSSDSNDVPVTESGLIIQELWYDAPELRHLISLASDADLNVLNDTTITSSTDPSIDPSYPEWGSEPATINYTGIIPYLVKAIKEKDEQIEELENRISKLEKSTFS